MKVPESANIQLGEDGVYRYVGRDGRRVRCKINVCAWCGEEYVCDPYHQRRMYCSRACSAAKRQATQPRTWTRPGPASANWKGGRKYVNGYIHVWAPDHHSLVGKNTTRKHVLEHRIVMEAHLGRPLSPRETVHHINGVKDDNRIENLELWNGAHPYGVRGPIVKHCPTCTCGNHT